MAGVKLSKFATVDETMCGDEACASAVCVLATGAEAGDAAGAAAIAAAEAVGVSVAAASAPSSLIETVAPPKLAAAAALPLLEEEEAADDEVAALAVSPGAAGACLVCEDCCGADKPAPRAFSSARNSEAASASTSTGPSLNPAPSICCICGAIMGGTIPFCRDRFSWGGIGCCMCMCMCMCVCWLPGGMWCMCCMCCMWCIC